MLAVKHSPCHAIPELIHRLEYDGEVSSSVASEKTVNVFEDHNLRATFANQAGKVVEEAGLVASESCSGPHTGEG